MTKWAAIRSEGGLVSYDELVRVAGGDAPGQAPADFGLDRRARVPDEIAEAWSDTQHYWAIFKRRLETPTASDPNGTAASRRWIPELLSLLGFATAPASPPGLLANGIAFEIFHAEGAGSAVFVPIHVEGHAFELDRRAAGKSRLSPQALVQDFLNQEGALWGIATNGKLLRLLRQSARTSRPAFVEFDLQSILEAGRLDEFALFWRLCHRSRFASAACAADRSWIEQYHQQSIAQGARVRERLGQGVEDALQRLGTGFLTHPDSTELRARIADGRLKPASLHRQLLMLVYRMLFLMVAEERHLIAAQGPAPDFDRCQRIYDEHYSLTHLRRRAEFIDSDATHADCWQGLRRTFSLFEFGRESNPLGIPPLNGNLFDTHTAIPDLDTAAIANRDLLLALRRLSQFTADGGAIERVNYRDLDVEELGSVYESLLDFRPVVQVAPAIPAAAVGAATNGSAGAEPPSAGGGSLFKLAEGSERKSTGSYYTRPELVHELVESALIPVLEARLAAARGRDAQIEAVLNLTVCDPACGSGHFLLAAARRLGRELARIKSGEAEPTPKEYQDAVREVIARCIFGVDLNPLAVDLCKLALWLEGHAAGKPLSFLDHRIRCGNALTGVFDPAALQAGIPDDAFAPLTGDDRKLASRLKKQNKKERESRGARSLPFDQEPEAVHAVADWRQLDAQPDDSPLQVHAKAERFAALRAGRELHHLESVYNLWTAQFFHPITPETGRACCATELFLDCLAGQRSAPFEIGQAAGPATAHRFFHWPLEFPAVFARGGFDVVLGNPPWERIKLQEQEFFAEEPWIMGAQHKAERDRRIAACATGTGRQRELFARFSAAKHSAEASGKFARASGRFPLSASGDINTYALFADLARQLIGPQGRAGIIVPTGIATDFTYKEFLGDLNHHNALASLFDFENREGLFEDVDSRTKFSLLTLSGEPVPQATFGFFFTNTGQLRDPRRIFALTPADFALLNPNTRTAPVFRTRVDAELTRKIYRNAPVLINQETGENPWGVKLSTMFHMSNDSGLFKTRDVMEAMGATLGGNRFRLPDGAAFLPLFEAKMFHQFDPCWATFDNGDFHDCTPTEKADPNFFPMPRYWVVESEVLDRAGPPRDLLAFRDITNATNERTCIAALLPWCGLSNKAPMITPGDPAGSAIIAANFNSIPLDFAARQKVGGTTLNFFLVNQFPIIPPDRFTPADRAWLAATPPHADLDAFFAHLYGLTRDELRYILDPHDVMGPDFPGETFRVLKENEMRQFGEYRTHRLVLEAFDRLALTPRFRDEYPTRTTIAPIAEKVTTATAHHA